MASERPKQLNTRIVKNNNTPQPSFFANAIESVANILIAAILFVVIYLLIPTLIWAVTLGQYAIVDMARSTWCEAVGSIVAASSVLGIACLSSNENN